MKHAFTMVTIVAATLFGVQILDAAPAHPKGGDHKSSLDRGFYPNATQVDIGQNDHQEEDPRREADQSRLTAEQRELKASFPELFQTEATIIQFSATWCGPCRRMKPQIAALKRDFHVVEFDVDSERGRQLYNHYGLKAIPHTIIASKGVAGKQFSGFTLAGQIARHSAKARKKDEAKNRYGGGAISIDWGPPANQHRCWAGAKCPYNPR